jgi:hypothetical protein
MNGSRKCGIQGRRGGGGETVKEGEYGVNLCIHVCKWKNDTY